MKEECIMTTEMFINELTAAMEREIMGPNGEEFLMGLGALAIIVTAMLAISAICALIHLVCRWRIFTKAGEKGWKALIPFYNTYTEFAITWTGKQGILMMIALAVSNYLYTAFAAEHTLIYLLAGILGVYGGVLGLIQTHKLSQSFGHKFGFTLGLFFLNPIFMLMLAFGKKSQYVGPIVNNK